ncbi:MULTISPECIES: protein-L-isoaspartate(D-aspartate) O-methyltransferase [Ignavibacterium]|jgi:protein-L-isoaspartate(D-aspartate) O-methyltransferase|uniref:protein-L-isoaspartate(D-aspartate) O-methyltransferase n=1 Tax=Ignavibacterium TaxID=795750 RepID=UPI0025BB3160|nr:MULTISPECIES: protein-L-isoaspartate(D-aspartate) O-methyltransferase [Ignavibacterium]MBI5661434.1 protein-L-isoaspartate(D-aspartate) O-methyltransferase [Ignavibacterium album]
MSRFQRQQLVETLRKKGITDERVLQAIGSIEREKFIPPTMVHLAYKDIALPIGYEQTISQPYTVAFMTEKLKVREGDKILEVGTGSGYQAAILEFLGAKVYSIEINLDLYHRTVKLFDKLGIRVHAKYGDGTIGWAEYAPFDGIIVTAGSPSIPPKLKEQLAVGGRLVIPVGGRDYQDLYVLTKLENNEFKTEVYPRFAFVPLLGKEGWEKK